MAAERLGRITDRVEVDGRHVSGRVQRAGRVAPWLLRDLDAGGVSLDSIEVHRPTLDDVFLTLTGRSLRDAEAASGSQPGTGPDPNAEPGRDAPSQLQGADR